MRTTHHIDHFGQHLRRNRGGIARREVQQHEDDERDHRHDDDGREQPPDYISEQVLGAVGSMPGGVERRLVVRSNAVPGLLFVDIPQ